MKRSLSLNQIKLSKLKLENIFELDKKKTQIFIYF